MWGAGRSAGTRLEELAEDVTGAAEDFAAAVKPRLRGWLHLCAAPVALVAGLVLMALSPAGSVRLAALVFTVTSVTLFTTSAVYHRGNWSPRVRQFLKRVDHSNIFLIIAGTYTPFAVALLDPGSARTLLWLVWSGAVLGALFRILWVGAPRWVYTPVYAALGWVAVLYIGDFRAAAGWWPVVLLLAGGVLYTLGALVYATKRPNPSPTAFGFHEVFHGLTLGGYALHWAGALVAVLTLA